MSMEFLETVGQVTLYVLIAVMAAGVAVAMGMLLGLLAAIIKDEFDEKDDKKMKEKKKSNIMLKSVENVRKRFKQGGSLEIEDYYAICEESLKLVGAFVTENPVTNMDMPFIAAAFQFWADTERRNLNTLPTATTANEIYHAALDIMQEMSITTTVRGIESDGK